MTDENLETLNASFDMTDQDMFMKNAEIIEELVETTTGHISFNTPLILPTKTLRQYPNNKGWLNSHLRKMITDQHHALKAGNIHNYREMQTDGHKAIKTANL